MDKKKIITLRYAEAFFSSIEDDNFEECFKDFEAFAAFYVGYEGLREVLNHPTIHPQRKIEMIQRIFGANAMKRVVDFICLLLRRKRINLLDAITMEVERLYRRKNNIRGIIVKSSIPLTQPERTKLRELLARKFGRVEIREVVDPDVVGGLIIQFGDQVIDDSLKARMKLLREMMIRVDSEWLLTLISQPSLAL